MTGAQVKRIRGTLDLTQEAFAVLIGVHAVTVAKWETDAQGIREPAARLIALLGKGAGKAALPKIRRPKLRAAKTRPVAKRKTR